MSAARNLSIEIETFPSGTLELRYALTGDLKQVAIPSPLPPIRSDNLWKHTCFEAFIAVEEEAGYYEFNFSPSGQWAAYAFSNYREPRQWKLSRPPCVRTDRTDNRLLLATAISSDDLPPNPAKKRFQINLTAVIETLDGRLSYWALHHPAAFPDFHDRGGFIQQLDATFCAAD
jgi:hypothetical protein